MTICPMRMPAPIRNSLSLATLSQRTALPPGCPGLPRRPGGRRVGAPARTCDDRAVPTILLLSTADTELLAARASGADYRVANPVRVAPAAIPALAAGADLVVLRLLGGRQAWPDGIS